jgi:hypothetical protein
MRYDLLVAEIRYMKDDTDTIPGSLAYIGEYYSLRGDNHNAARAYYYEGDVYINCGNYDFAIVNLLRAAKYSDMCGDVFLSARINRRIGDSYNYLSDYSSSLYYYKISLDQFISTQKDIYIGYAYNDLSIAHYMINDYKQALAYADSAYNISIAINDLELKKEAMHTIGNIYLQNKEYTKYINIFNSIMSNNLCDTPSQEFANAGIAYFCNNNVDSAIAYNKYLREINDTSLMGLTLDFYISKYRGNYKHALEDLTKLTDAQNKEVENIWFRNDASIINNYYSLEESKMRSEIVNNKRVMALTCITILLLILCAAILLYYKTKSIKNDRERTQMQILQLRDELLTVKDSKLEQAHDLLSHKYKWIADFDLAMNLTDESRLQSGKFYNKFKSKILDLASRESLRDLEQLINKHLDNVVSKFLTDFPNSTEHDIEILIFSILNLSTQSISLLLQIEQKTIYNRKYRLKSKIENSKSIYKDEILKYL